MTLIAYKEHKFVDSTLELIEQANTIIADYEAQGYKLTLRQLYYQFIAMDYPNFPNNEKSYNRLGETISNARLAGLISWDAIEDKTRNIVKRNMWEHPQEFARDAQQWFHIDMWANQPNYVECWVEKDALVGVIERPCWELSVPFMACRGYMSQSEEWAAANRFEQAYHEEGKNPVLLYLGDHDPSGLDMSRDHNDRLTLFLEHLGVNVDVRRIALNIDQVRRYKPPPNPTKPKDSRTDPYVERFGKTCWELDALRPNVIDQLVRDRVDELRDMDRWAEKEAELADKRERLARLTLLGINAYEAEEQRKSDLYMGPIDGNDE